MNENLDQALWPVKFVIKTINERIIAIIIKYLNYFLVGKRNELSMKIFELFSCGKKKENSMKKASLFKINNSATLM